MPNLKIAKGAQLVVERGRKVPIGTTGTCIWYGESQYGWRVGIKDAAGEIHWTSAGNVAVVIPPTDPGYYETAITPVPAVSPTVAPEPAVIDEIARDLAAVDAGPAPAPAPTTNRCDNCGGSGIFRWGGGTVNGVWKGHEGTCYRCNGKGVQTPRDARRNYYYDSHIRRFEA